jgi:hypothetical protein
LWSIRDSPLIAASKAKYAAQFVSEKAREDEHRSGGYARTTAQNAAEGLERRRGARQV